MPMPLKAMVLIVALIVWLPAEAQFLGFGLESNIELTKNDLAIIHRTVDEQIHGKAVGTTASWNNSDSGNYGSIKAAQKV